MDAAGNAYISDEMNNNIRKISPAGVVSLFAGSPQGVSGHSDGQGAAASFNGPRGLACDRAGNVYVADSANKTIRKISPGGTVSTLAGLAQASGDADGPGAQARFRSPVGIAVDEGGTVYVTGNENASVRVISPDGVVSTISRPGLPAGKFQPRPNLPEGIAVDHQGQLFVVDFDSGGVWKIARNGAITELKLQASAADQKLYPRLLVIASPTAISVDSAGNLYVTSDQLWPLRKITPDGHVSVVAGKEQPILYRP
jgi:sugar lactone lactonase YvrE